MPSPTHLDADSTSAARTVLVPVDFSPHARAAALQACDLARACGAQVRLLHGFDAKGGEGSSPLAAIGRIDPESSASRELASWCADFSRQGAPISAVVEQGDPVAMISRHSLGENVFLIVMGMHGCQGLDRLFLGSVADRALRAATVPILLVQGGERDSGNPIRRILLATDFSPASEHALRLAIHWARRLEADIEVLHAIQGRAEEPRYPRPRDSVSRSGDQRVNALESLRSILSRTAAAGVRAVADLTYGAPSIEIVKHAARSYADLVVLGLRAHSEASPARYGSVTERVIRHVKCSVLVAPETPRA